MLRLFAFVFILFFLSFCSDPVVEESSFGTSSSNKESSSSSFSSTRVGGDLFVYAIDAVSGNAIPNAEFFLLAVDKVPRKSNGTGGTVYRDLPIGENYAVSVRVPGYANVVCDASIKIAAGQTGQTTPVAENATLKVPLRKLSASLRGSIFYQDVKNPHQTELSAATGAGISVYMQEDECSYENRVFCAVKADKDGFFSFDSLPEKAAYTLIAHDAELGGFLYSGIELSGTLGTSGNATIVPRIVYSVAQTAFGFMINSDNRLSAEKGDTLMFGFSEPVNTLLLRSGDLSVTKAEVGKVPVAVNFEWGNSNKTLKIIPAFGQWEPSRSYEITLKLYSALSSKIIDTALVFLVNEFFDLSKISVSGIKTDAQVNHNAYSVTLRWNAIANAEAYEIYAKASSKLDAVYSLVGTVSTKTKGVVDTSFVLQTSNWFLNADSALVLVAARNGKGKSAFGEPFVIKDNVPPQITIGPYVNPDTANYVMDASAYFNNTMAASSPYTYIYFNEPMDTAAVLHANIGQSPRPVSTELKWANETVLSVSFGIGAGELNGSEEHLSIPIMVLGLRDKVGNPFKGTAIGSKNWDDLLIILYAAGVKP